ncbi:MAG: tRNA preQ1(34) S-adenosylmethionine ribosyltransferase-isomerase QueA [bacterium]
MQTSDFDYNLPKELIAQSPVSPRDSSRMMVVDRITKTIRHRQFHDIINYLQAGDLLVWNNSKVFKARLQGKVMLDQASDNIDDKKEANLDLTDRILNMPTVEIFLLRPMENFGVWKVLAKPGRKLRLGMKIVFAEDFYCEVLLKEKDGTVLVEFQEDDMSVRAKANQYGQVPTPPYIKDLKTKDLENDYQTIYAKHEGSVAAPTAGFHFTPELIEKLKNQGIEFAEVTLHVGLGTFQPVKTDKVEKHQMHSEYVELTASNADLINQAKADGRRVVAVGTTTVRTLEGVAQLSLRACLSGKQGAEGDEAILLKPHTGDINLFITPGYEFKIIDALITNFHLPKSTLLMLVSALVGDRKFMLDCYQQAVEANYRFYSFGDAMFIN